MSRSDEAKALGLKMGESWFDVRNRPHLAALVARSSNYSEYGNFSSRFHDTIASLASEMGVYSIDEAFVTLPRHGHTDPAAAAAAIQDRVRQWTGLPTSAGVGTTKTLAKVAQRRAKSIGAPLCDLSTWHPGDVADLLAATPVEDVWGIGDRLRHGLSGLGIHTALDLARADAGMLRRRWSVVLERTARELAGTACLPVGFEPKPRQQIMFSRLLGAAVTTRTEMRQVLAAYGAMAARRLRRYHLEASLVHVWVSTSRYRDQIEHHSVARALDPPTADPLAIVDAAYAVLPNMIEGRPYTRAGIMLTGLAPAGVQPVLDTEPAVARRRVEREQLASTVDEISSRYGRHVVGYGSTGLRARPRWDMRREHLSPAATTRWDQLLTVR